MTDLEHKILASIERQKLQPKPAYVFFARRSVFWLLAIVSIVLGGISAAILFYWLGGFLRDGRQIFDNVPLEEVLFSIPVAWLVTMPLFIASANFGFRHTRRGYRRNPAKMIALSMAASLMLGGLLQGFGIGFHIHKFLKINMPYYERLTHIPFAEWSRPDEGFLGGRTVKMLDANTLELIDFQNKAWTIDLSGATITLDNSIVDEGDIAIRGVRTGPATYKADSIAEFD